LTTDQPSPDSTSWKIDAPNVSCVVKRTRHASESPGVLPPCPKPLRRAAVAGSKSPELHDQLSSEQVLNTVEAVRTDAEEARHAGI
jgi:hypothetical protein